MVSDNNDLGLVLNYVTVLLVHLGGPNDYQTAGQFLLLCAVWGPIQSGRR